MLSLEERADLLVRVAEFGGRREHREIVALLSLLSDDDLFSDPELAFRLALAHFHLSQFPETQELVDRLVDPCRRRGFDQLYRRRLNLQGNLFTERGDTISAEAAYLEVLDRSVAADDHRWIAFATINLSAIAGIRGEWMHAIAAAQRGLTALQRIGDTYHLAGCHQNLGLAYLALGLHHRAESHFEKAVQLYLSSGFDVTEELASLAIERAASISASGDHRRAEGVVSHAMDTLYALAARGYRVRRGIGEGLRVLGMVQIAESRNSEARETLVLALAIAKEEEVLLLEGEIAQALSDLSIAENRRAEALEWAGQAGDIFAKLGAHARTRELSRRLQHVCAG